MRYLTVGGLTIDDVVSLDRRLTCDVPGGNALYSALGARLWNADVAILAFAGDDYPASVLAELCEAGIDVSLVPALSGPSIHLWVLYEPDGRRQITYQHRSSQLGELAAVVERELPGAASRLDTAGAVHVAALPVWLQRTLLERVRPLGRQVTLDTIEAHGTVGGDLDAYLDNSVFDGVAAFLPSEEEFAVIVGDRDRTLAIRDLAGTGPRYVLVKQGERGVWIYDTERLTERRVAAYPTRLVDPTGAGDAFCGGFMVGLNETGDVLEAALRGTVSASFVIEAVGGLHMLAVTRSGAEQRLDDLRRAQRG